MVLYRPWRRRVDARRAALGSSSYGEDIVISSDIDEDIEHNSDAHGMPEIISGVPREPDRVDVKT